MSFNFTLSAILRQRWLIEKSWAEAYLPVVLSMIKGEPVSSVERTGNQQIEQPFVVDPKTMNRFKATIWSGSDYVANPNVPPNSVGVIPISGPVTKYNGDCGEPGAIQRNNWLMQMEKLSNINSVVLLMDTPGGEARAANSMVPTIDNYSKPILGYGDGMIASLGVWYSAGLDETYMSNELDEIGSVGSYLTMFDVRDYFEQQGIKIHEIYAPQSTDKNKDYRDALNGDYTEIQKDLGIHVNSFINYVASNRGPKAAASQKQWSTGKMFYAGDAQKLGLIDGVKPFSQVVSKASWLGRRNKN